MQSIHSQRASSSALFACTLALGLVATALLVTLLLQSFISTAGFIFFYAAVVSSAWFGGKWSGLLAVVLSMLALAYFFMPPAYSFAVGPESLPLFLEFAASAVIVSWFSSWRKVAETELKYARDELQLRVEERTAELRHSNEQLLAEMAERKRAEEAYYEARTELARANRVSALGTLAASISHEVNQPLAAVVTNADACAIWLAADPPNLEEARAAVECVAREGTRASDVVRRIRAMFTKSAPETSQIEVNGLIREVGALLQAEVSRHQIALDIVLAADLPNAAADRVQLQQVLVNLVLNGIEAMSAVAGRPRLLSVRSEMRGPEEILVSVRDSGVGIESGDQRRIFDAFFTTKSQGMGMGLSISQTIIETHGGRLWATANDGPGATLQFTLPTARSTAS